MDTQWARYEVFVQEKTGAPYQDYGSVHAPDAELALMNARDVFARRPEACSMWVVPTEAIFSRTAEELEQGDWLAAGLLPPDAPAGENRFFEIFCKEKTAGTLTWIARVEASSPAGALRLALQQKEGLKAFVWWAVPSREMASSGPEEIDSMFAPAREKRFRMSTDFKTHSVMLKIKGEG